MLPPFGGSTMQWPIMNRALCTHSSVLASAFVIAVLASPATRARAQAPTTVTLRARTPGESAPRTLAAVRATDRIRIDGRIDEAAWRDAPVGTDFVQRAPDVLQPATQRT